MKHPAARAKAQAAQAPRERTKGELVEPIYLIKLMEAVGPTQAARLIGTTPGTLHKGRNAGVVSRVYETAARGICHEMLMSEEPTVAAARTEDLGVAAPSPTNDTLALMLIQVPRERAPMLQRAAETLGATVISHD